MKVGDYINGRRIEEVIRLHNEPYYLVTYFDWKSKKPQSRYIPESTVSSFVSAEEFAQLAHSKSECCSFKDA